MNDGGIEISVSISIGLLPLKSNAAKLNGAGKERPP